MNMAGRIRHARRGTDGSRRPVAGAIALVVALLAWALWSLVRVQFAQDPVARHAVESCGARQARVFVYRVTALKHGAVCTALIHQDTFYSYMLGTMIPAHWARLDCEVNTTRDLPFCEDITLRGPGDWAILMAPPPPTVLAMSAIGVRS